MKTAAAVLAALALAVPARTQQGAADDLSIVKRAVQAAPALPGPADKPTWLRVRVVEPDGRTKLSVNLPLALVRALGDDFPLRWACTGARGACRTRVAEVLGALAAGQELVEIDQRGARVRVWVE